MADKKPDKKGGDKKKEAPKPASPYVIVAGVVAAFFIAYQLSILAATWFGVAAPEGSTGFFDPEFISSFKRFVLVIFSSVQAISVFLSLLFIIGIIYAKFRIGQIKRFVVLNHKVKVAEVSKIEKGSKVENKKWKKV